MRQLACTKVSVVAKMAPVGSVLKVSTTYWYPLAPAIRDQLQVALLSVILVILAELTL